MGRNWSRSAYRPAEAEFAYARFCYCQGEWKEASYAHAEQLARTGANRFVIRSLHALRGSWCLEQKEWALAAESLSEAVRMARERSLTDSEAETGLALAKFHLGQLTDPASELERLSQLRNPAHRLLALLHLAIGEIEQAKQQALAAYKWAWADGEPFVNRYELTKTTELLQQMNVPIPNLPPYDPATYVKFPWEDELVAAIEQLRAEKENQAP
jgi:hypothetical protein